MTTFSHHYIYIACTGCSYAPVTERAGCHRIPCKCSIDEIIFYRALNLCFVTFNFILKTVLLNIVNCDNSHQDNVCVLLSVRICYYTLSLLLLMDNYQIGPSFMQCNHFGLLCYSSTFLYQLQFSPVLF